MIDDSPLGFYSKINSDDTDKRLFAERIKLAYSHAETVITASLMAVAVVDVIVWGETSVNRIVVWSAFVAIVCFYGYLQIIRFSRERTNIDNMTPWKLKFLGTSFAMGVLWGWGTISLPPGDSAIHQVFLILMAGCLAAGSVATHSVVIESVLLFSIPALTPIAGKLISSGEDVYTMMGYVTLLYLMFLISIARRISGAVCSTLKLKYENSDLINSMQKSVLELSMAKDSLAKSEDRFRNLAEASFEGVLIVENGFIIDFNNALLSSTGYNAEQLGGKRMLDLVVPDYHALIKRRLSMDDNTPAEILMKAKSGSVLPVEVRSKAANYKGAAIRVLTFRDIRERKKTEKNLLEAKSKAEEATRLKDMFVSLVAHDLKTPINSIIGLLEHLQTNKPRDMDKMIGTMRESGARMTEMIDELLSLSRLRAGKIVPQMKLVHTREIVDAAVSSHVQIAKRKGITLDNTIHPDNMVFTDPDLFGHILRNLVSNAVKFCSEGDTVKIHNPDGVSPLVVTDTGPGIKPEILMNIFQHDRPISTKGSEGERGTGLGLPFSKELMEVLEGTLSLKTSSDGTSVYLYMPVRKPKVLLVDDDQAVLAMCKHSLRSLDVDVMESCNGADALKIISENTVDLVISDVMMPEVDGFSLLETMRNDKRTSTLPVIIITGEKGNGIKEKAFRLGATDFLRKQDHGGEILESVRKRFYQ